MMQLQILVIVIGMPGIVIYAMSMQLLTIEATKYYSTKKTGCWILFGE